MSQPSAGTRGASSVGTAEGAPSCLYRAACALRACPAGLRRRKFPSCLCMSLSFTRGCSLSLLGSYRLLRRLRRSARVCAPACSRRSWSDLRRGGAQARPPAQAAWRQGDVAQPPCRSVRSALGAGPSSPAAPSAPAPLSSPCARRGVLVEQPGEKACSHGCVRRQASAFCPATMSHCLGLDKRTNKHAPKSCCSISRFQRPLPAPPIPPTPKQETEARMMEPRSAEQEATSYKGQSLLLEKAGFGRGLRRPLLLTLWSQPADLGTVPLMHPVPQHLGTDFGLRWARDLHSPLAV